MRRIFALLPLVALWSCGYVGDPLPPALNIPNRVTDLAAVERGDKIVVTFTLPAMTTENMDVKHMGPVEIQIGDKTVESKAMKPGPAIEEIPARDWVGKQPAIKVRVNNGRGRFSQWSNEVVLPVVEPVQPPTDVSADADAKGVKVTWEAPPRAGQTWRVYRQDQPDAPATVDKPEYIDSGTEYGKEYTYRIQGVVGKAESEMSQAKSVTPVDKFPPAVPSGVTFIQGINDVELTWDPNTDPDFKTYRVYRSTGAGELQLLAGDVPQPSYSDKQVSANQTYRYAVTAVDQNGNESVKSQAVEVRTR